MFIFNIIYISLGDERNRDVGFTLRPTIVIVSVLLLVLVYEYTFD